MALVVLCSLVAVAPLAKPSPNIDEGPGSKPKQVGAVRGDAALANILQKLSDPKWEVRGGAVRSLDSVPAARIRTGLRRQLIALLREETAALEDKLQGTSSTAYPPTGESGEGWAEYYAELLRAVIRLQDQAALPALVGAAWQPSSVDSEIARYGAPLIAVVASRLNELNRMQAALPGFSGAFFPSYEAMADILTDLMLLDQDKTLKPPLSPSDYDDIRRALRPLLDSPNNYVRLYTAIALAKASDVGSAARIRQVFAGFFAASIPGERSIGLDKILARVDEARFVPLEKVEELAQSDPYHYLKTTNSGKITVYPVRERARLVLEKFKKGNN